MASNKPIEIRIPDETHKHLGVLSKVGGYGSNKSEVARKFIYDGIQKALKIGVLKVPKETQD